MAVQVHTLNTLNSRMCSSSTEGFRPPVHPGLGDRVPPRDRVLSLSASKQVLQ